MTDAPPQIAGVERWRWRAACDGGATGIVRTRMRGREDRERQSGAERSSAGRRCGELTTRHSNVYPFARTRRLTVTILS